MSNSSGLLLNSSNFSSNSIPSFDELLATLGFSQWLTVVSSFVMPGISLLGIVLCSVSAFVFFQRQFVDPVFFYYRLLCLTYVLHLTIGIPYGIFYSPKYFLQIIDTYSTSNYLLVYAGLSGLLYHFEDTLQMAILLTRMKIFSPYVNRHFTLKPKFVSLIFFFTCLCINLPFVFALKIRFNGNYSYYDSNNSNQPKTSSFYSVVSSEFSSSPIGQILYGFTSFFLNLFLTLVVGLIMNIVSVYQYKSYLRKRSKRDEAYRRAAFSLNKPPLEAQQATTSLDEVVSVVVVTPQRPHSMTAKERNDQKAETNMFFMALTLSIISTLTRVFFMISFIIFFVLNYFGGFFNLYIISYSIYTLVPTMAIFVFYSFNKIFRQEFVKKILRKKFVKNSSSIQRTN
jgi:hypothetical protein